MTPTETVTLAGFGYGVTAFAFTVLEGFATSFAARLRQMLATIVAAAVGAFGASRGLPLEQLVVSAAAVAILAAIVCRRHRRLDSPTTWALAIVLGIVLFAAILDGEWLVAGAALLASLPFFLTALVVKARSGPLFDALVAALAGALLGFAGAYCALFVACLVTIGIAKWRHVRSTDIAFAPAIAAVGTLEILVSVALRT